MKILLLLLTFFVAFQSEAQVHTTLLPEAELFYERVMNQAKPKIIALVNQKARKLRDHHINGDSLCYELRRNKKIEKAQVSEADAIAILILIKASYGIDDELKKIVMNLAGDQKAQKAAYDKTAPLMIRKSHIAEEVNALIKKYQGSEQLVLEQLR